MINKRKYFSSFFKLTTTAIAAIFFVSSFQKSNKNDDSFNTLKKLRLDVLKADSIGKDFEYDLTGQKGCHKTKLTYLGIVTTKKLKKYKLLNSFWVTGYSCKGISRLVIYDTNNVYLGNYNFDMPYELPDELINNEIVYNSSHEDCKNRKGMKISFKSGLPKSFYVCQNSHYFQGNE
jgi:hypothetical protein